MRVGILRFPGSNCDFDTFQYFKRHGHRPEFVWHKDQKLLAWDLLVVPGGFAFGDRVYTKATEKFSIDPGVLALKSPVMEIVHKFAEKRPVLGICNGFQILIKSGLLPGSLEQNKAGKFFCDWTTCEVTGQSFFGDNRMSGRKFRVPVAHGYGKYVVEDKLYRKLKANGQIFLKYIDNPNGSHKNIAGVCNSQGNVFGLMPHPERTPDGKYFIKAIEKYVAG